MKELIKVTRENDKQLVSARELHKGLEIGTQFKDWMPRMISYGFIEGEDFSSFLGESTGGRPSQEYIITLDMAKHLCMIQRNELGMKFRNYFIDCEKSLLQTSREDELWVKIGRGTATQSELLEHKQLSDARSKAEGIAEAINKRDADKIYYHTGRFLEILNEKLFEVGIDKIKYLNSTSFHKFLVKKSYGEWKARYFYPNDVFITKMNTSGWGVVSPLGDNKFRTTYDESFTEVFLNYPSNIELLRNICFENRNSEDK